MPESVTILYADIVGYMAMIGNDDVEAVRLLRRNRAIHRKLIPRHKGRLIAELEDGIFSMFDLPSQGVSCAIELQRTLQNNDSLALRIGLHSGAVHKQSGRLSGEGAAGAAFLESNAQAGGICISGAVYDSLQELPGIRSIYLGSRHGKGIKGAMPVYALTGDGLVGPPDHYGHRLRRSSGLAHSGAGTRDR